MALNTHTVSDVINYVTRQFGDESQVQLLSSDIIRWINQGQMEINSKNLVLRNSSTTPVVSGQDTYAKPSDCMRVTAIKYDTWLLPYIGFDQYQLKYQGPTAGTGTLVPLSWTQFGDQIILAPPPSDSSKLITIYYIPETPLNKTGTETLALPDRYFDRLCEYVMSKAYELDEDWNAHQVQRGLLETGLTAMSNEETNAQGPYPVVVDYSYDDYYGRSYNNYYDNYYPAG